MVLIVFEPAWQQQSKAWKHRKKMKGIVALSPWEGNAWKHPRRPGMACASRGRNVESWPA